MAVHVTLMIHHDKHQYSAKAQISAAGWRDTGMEAVTGQERTAVSKEAKVKIEERARLLVAGTVKPEAHPLHGLNSGSTSETYTLMV